VSVNEEENGKGSNYTSDQSML